MKTLIFILAFLARDYTNYIQPTRYFWCTDYSNTLVARARAENIMAWRVDIFFTYKVGHVTYIMGHSIVAFQTTDGFVYVEPQTDTVYSNVKVGNRLCSADENLCVGEEPISKIIYQYIINTNSVEAK
jgi:hypothetical protein